VPEERKFLALAAKEKDCAAALFFFLAVVVPCLYSACRIVGTGSESTTTLAMGLAIRLGVAVPIGAACSYLLWRRRRDCTAPSLGVALVWTAILYGSMGAAILITGQQICGGHSSNCPAEPRVHALPLLAWAILAFGLGATIVKFTRRRAQPPNNRWRGP
jgi:hypothetical protein